MVLGKDELGRLELGVWIASYVSFADANSMYKRHSLMMTALHRIVNEMGLEFYPPMQSVKLVN